MIDPDLINATNTLAHSARENFVAVIGGVVGEIAVIFAIGFTIAFLYVMIRGDKSKIGKGPFGV